MGSHCTGPMSSGAADAAAPEELPGSWDGVCDWVLGRWVSVWDEIFEAAFLARAKAIIAAAFTQARVVTPSWHFTRNPNPNPNADPQLEPGRNLIRTLQHRVTPAPCAKYLRTNGSPCDRACPADMSDVDGPWDLPTSRHPAAPHVAGQHWRRRAAGRGAVAGDGEPRGPAGRLPRHRQLAGLCRRPPAAAQCVMPGAVTPGTLFLSISLHARDWHHTRRTEAPSHLHRAPSAVR